MKQISKSKKEIDDFNKYEVIERKRMPGFGKSNYFSIKEGKHIGDYTIQEILDFDECELNRPQLTRRIERIQDKTGVLFTLLEAITAPLKPKFAKTDRKVIEKAKEKINFLDAMKMMTPTKRFK